MKSLNRIIGLKRDFRIGTTFHLLFLFLFISSSSSLNAQEDQPTLAPHPKSIPTEGYWVIESNKNQPEVSVIYYYNSKNELLKKEEVSGKLNTSKVKTKKWLCEQLALAVRAAKKEETIVKKQ